MARAVLASTLLTMSSSAYAQADPQPSSTFASGGVDRPWSFEFGIGWDNSISGNINSSGIGRINNQAVVILKNSYEDVYGTGLHLLFGGGYLIDEVSEIRATFTFQSLDADHVDQNVVGTALAKNLWG